MWKKRLSCNDQFRPRSSNKTERSLLMSKRPGEASVQYGDVRGEAAADVSDRLSNMLDGAAKELGFEGPGQVVGISIYGGDDHPDPDTGYVTFQVVESPIGAEKMNKALAESGGELVVKEYFKTGVPITDFVRCFKRLNISLFSSYIKPETISVEDHIDIEDENEDE